MKLVLNFRLLVLLGSLAMASAAAQEPGGQFTLAGTVVNAKTGEPLKRAQVQIRRFPVLARFQAIETTPQIVSPGYSASAMTDPSGAFRFTGLIAGDYSVSASKPEFVADGTAFTHNTIIKLSTNTEDVRLQLSPLGVISGRVVDQDGQPMLNVGIAIQREQIVDGFRDIVPDRNVQTDDRGMYRVWNLQPGKYYVKAAGRSGSTTLYAGDRAPAYAVRDGFTPLYFGGSRSVRSAAPITIEAGSDTHADLVLTMGPVYRIRGSLSGFAPRQTVKFELLSGPDDASVTRASVGGDTGRFEVLDVAPGSYTLRATQGETRGDVPVNVTGADVEGVGVTLSPGVTLEEHVRVTDIPKDMKDPDTGEPIEIDGEQLGRSCRIVLHPDGHARPQAGLPPLSGILPGSYQVTVTCFSAYVTSALFGSQDVLSNPTIVIEAGAAPPPFEIVAHFGGGAVHGKVTPEAAGAQPMVLLVPQFSPTSGPVMARAFGRGREAEFQSDALAPGDYVVYAFSRGDDVEFRNPEVLRALIGGTAVRLEAGDNKEITIDSVVK